MSIGGIFREVAKPFLRSGSWYTVRRKHLKEFPYCAACGKKYGLQVHHIKPFSRYPSLELDPGNLLTLCNSNCHLMVGHLRYWKSFNEYVREDAARILNRIKTRP